jgi:natural product precursor
MKMKKVNFNGKLSLNKETISKLNNGQMGHLIGGGKSVAPNPSEAVTCTTTIILSGSNATNSPAQTGIQIIDCCL